MPGSRGLLGWVTKVNPTTNKLSGLKWGRVAGVGGAGLLGWSLLDRNAGAKIGDAAGGVGNTVGSLFGGLGSGVLGGLFQPQYLMGSCSSCILSCIALVVFFLFKQ